MAVITSGYTTIPDLSKKDPSPRLCSVVETIQIYHEDVPPPLPLKDAKYRKVSYQRSLADTLGIYKESNMYPSSKGYECENNTSNTYRRDSVLDSPFRCYFDLKIEDSTSQLIHFGHESTEALWDSYCSSGSSRSTLSPRDSLLPPISQPQSSCSATASYGQSPFPPPQRPLPVTPLTEQPVRRANFESPSKRSVTSYQLEQYRNSPLPAILHRARTPSPASPFSQNCARPLAPSPSSASSALTSSMHSEMSSYSNSEIISPPTPAYSSFSAPAGSGSVKQPRWRTRKPANIIQPECLSSTRLGRTISMPLETKSTSPICPDFNLGFPAHDFETRRQSPASPTNSTEAAIVSTQFFTSNSAFTPSLTTPTSPSSSLQPLLPSPLQSQQQQQQSAEVSAFDSDTDDEGLGNLRKKLSRPFLGPLRTRAETVPTATTNHHHIKNSSSVRAIPKGHFGVQKRTSKQDIRMPALRVSGGSENENRNRNRALADADASLQRGFRATAGVAAPSPTPTGMTLWKKMSRKDSPPLTSGSERSSAASKRSAAAASGRDVVAEKVSGSGKGKGPPSASSGKKSVRNWFGRVFGRRRRRRTTW